MKPEYYAVKFYLDNRIGYLLWSTQSDESDIDQDKVLVQDGFAPCFKNLSDLKRFAIDTHGLNYVDEPPLLHDLQIVARWLRLKKMKRGRQANPEFLAAWNIFADLARGLHTPFRGNLPELNHLYSKLFWSQNLPSMTPEGCFYVPIYSNRELQMMHDVLSEGLSLWRRTVKNWRG